MENIRTMECLEHIRYRHGMYIGQIGDGYSPGDAIYTMLKEITEELIRLWYDVFR